VDGRSHPWWETDGRHARCPLPYGSRTPVARSVAASSVGIHFP
jgi:hypothetical protein